MIRHVHVKYNFKPDDLVPGKRQLARAGKVIAHLMEKRIRERTKKGRFGPASTRGSSYSTRPHFFDITKPRGARSRFARHLRAEGYRGRSNRRYVKMPLGYAQFRSIFRGEPLSISPVTLELTGHMLRSMTGVSSVRKDGQVYARIKFPTKSHYGGPSAAQKAEWQNRERQFLYLTDAEADAITRKGFAATGIRLTAKT